MRAESRRRALGRQRGQALAETLVAALALVPLALLVVLLGKYQAMQGATIAASRTLAFECTVRASACADVAGHPALADELRRRHFARADRELMTGDALPAGVSGPERHALFADRRNRPLLESWADVGAAVEPVHFDAGVSTALGRGGSLVSGAADLLSRAAGPERFGLDASGGMVDARVQARVSPSRAGNERFAVLDAMPLTFRARTAILGDPWNASGPYGAAPHSVQSRVQRGSRLDPVRETAFDLGFQLTKWSLGLMGAISLESTAREFRHREVDVDRVPADRVGP